MFAYPDKTPIVIYGNSKQARIAYYRFRTRFNVLGFLSPKETDASMCGVPVFQNSQIGQLRQEGAKLVIVDDNAGTVYTSLMQGRGLKIYDDFVPIWLMEYQSIDALWLYMSCEEKEFARLLRLFMQGKKGVLINGNCQTEPLAKYLMHNPRFDKEYIFLKSTVVHRYNEKTIKILNNQDFLNSISLFLTQKISINNSFFREAGSEIMIRKLPKECKKVIINNFWFEGYFPQHKKNEFNVLKDTFAYGAFNWGDELLDSMVSKGMDADDIFEAAHDVNLIADDDIENLIQSQFADMRQRESYCDIRMADYIQSHYKDEVLFYSANHPINKLIKEAAVRILRHIALYAENEDVPFHYEYAIDSRPLLNSVTETVYPSVLKHLGLLQDKDKLSYSVLFGEFCDFSDYVRNYLSFCHNMQVNK